MSETPSRLRRFGPPIVASLLFATCAVGFFLSKRTYEDLKYAMEALVSLLAFLFSDEFSDLTGHYGWTRQQWRHYPAEAIRWIGGIMLVVLTYRVVFP